MSAFPAPGSNPYLRTQIQSRTPLELVVMLYDGAIRFTRDAHEAIGRRDIARRGEAISRAMAIISELQNTLNMTAGGAIATELDRLYTYVRERLLDASFRQDARPLDDALKVLLTLREGWTEIAAQPTQPAPR